VREEGRRDEGEEKRDGEQKKDRENRREMGLTEERWGEER
jgi:hypothetical protein